MVFNFLFGKKKGLKKQDGTQQPAESQEQDGKKAKESIEERIDREMESLPGFVKNKIKDPSVKQKFIEIAKRMEKDGVDMNSPRAMKKWVKQNEKQIKEENQPGGKVETIVKTQPEPGRNDACPCGSGKKYKKCCGK